MSKDSERASEIIKEFENFSPVMTQADRENLLDELNDIIKK